MPNATDMQQNNLHWIYRFDIIENAIRALQVRALTSSVTLVTLQRSSHYLIDHEVEKEWREWASLTDTALCTEAFEELAVHPHTSESLRLQSTYYVYKLPGGSLMSSRFQEIRPVYRVECALEIQED
ncbi:hypothetical protein CSKR_113139 [Clonorchis sinensis]|nr:hypothetical protein CSKR_113139 [Clonorchis sinensis]